MTLVLVKLGLNYDIVISTYVISDILIFTAPDRVKLSSCQGIVLLKGKEFSSTTYFNKKNSMFWYGA